MKRIICILLVLVMLSAGLVSCKKPTEEELLPRISELLAASATVNELCFGKGIVADEDGRAIGSYREAEKDSLAAFGVENTTDIRHMIAKVYAKETTDWISSIILEAVFAESGAQSYARYYDGEEKDEDGRLIWQAFMVNKNYEPMVDGALSYSDVKITKIKRDYVEFTVDITVTKDGKKSVLQDEDCSARLENGVWLLSSPTYARFESGIEIQADE